MVLGRRSDQAIQEAHPVWKTQELVSAQRKLRDGLGEGQDGELREAALGRSLHRERAAPCQDFEHRDCRDAADSRLRPVSEPVECGWLASEQVDQHAGVVQGASRADLDLIQGVSSVRLRTRLSP